MNKKLILTSMLAIWAVGPAMAITTVQLADYPTDGIVKEDKRYLQAATKDKLDGVYEDVVYAIAEYGPMAIAVPAGEYLPRSQIDTVACLAGYYCPGSAGSVAYSETEDQLLTACPTDYTSDSGASVKTQCYTSAGCATVRGATGMTGHNYWGTAFDTCEPTACEQGWTKTAHTDGISGSELYKLAGSNGSDIVSATATAGSLPANAINFYSGFEAGGWGMNFSVDQQGRTLSVYGSSYCSYDTSGTTNYQSEVPYTLTQSEIESRGNGDACFCKLSAYKDSANGNTWTNLYSDWVFAERISGGASSDCYASCSAKCAEVVRLAKDSSYVNWSNALFSAASGTVLARCDANVIKVKWYGTTLANVTTNEAGTVTYGGNINTPVAADASQTPRGKVFRGWRFSKTVPSDIPQGVQLANPD